MNPRTRKMVELCWKIRPWALGLLVAWCVFPLTGHAQAPCCEIVAINAPARLVTARDIVSQRGFQFSVQNLKVARGRYETIPCLTGSAGRLQRHSLLRGEQASRGGMGEDTHSFEHASAAANSAPSTARAGATAANSAPSTEPEYPRQPLPPRQLLPRPADTDVHRRREEGPPTRW